MGPEVRTLLVTDLVDSTALVERLGDTRAAALSARHDALARDLMPRFDGQEIDRTDGFLVLFDHPRDAVGYAVAYHTGVAALGRDHGEPLAARAAIHCGPVVLRENPPDHVARGAKPLEVEGLLKPTTARIAAIARGGQTLLTAEACARAGELAPLVATRLGHWRFKGLADPVELYDVGDGTVDGRPPEDGPKGFRVTATVQGWSTTRELPHTLPREVDPFVGRGEDLTWIAARLEVAPLVTVLGTGGTGKTRLVTRYGHDWLGAWPGGVWFCDLADARDVEGIVRNVARGLSLDLSSADPVAEIGRAMAARGRALFVFDNLEQVARHAPDTIGVWQRITSRGAFLVTTREVLGLPGEEVVTLAPLRSEEGLELFVSRARAARRDFDPAPSLDAIRSIVAAVDGLPLAIELAAARVRAVSPEALLARMSDRFAVLASVGRRVDRHATLRSTIDGSWELLAEWERAAFATMSVFDGGFDLPSAEAVLDLGAWADAPWIVDVVQSLVDKSLLRTSDGVRYTMLVSLREYAAEKLATLEAFTGSGPAVQSAELRHARWFAARPPARSDPDLDNRLLAIRRALAASEASTAAEALNHAWASLVSRGPLALALALTLAVAALPGLTERQRVRTALQHASALGANGDLPASARELREVARLARDLGLADLELHAWLALARSPAVTVVEAAEALDQARGLHLEAPGSRADLLVAESGLHVRTGRLDDAERAVFQALALTTDGLARARMQSKLGYLRWRREDLEGARAGYTAAAEGGAAAGDAELVASASGNLGVLAWMQGRVDEAIQAYQSTEAYHRRIGAPVAAAHWRLNQGVVFHQLGRVDDAERAAIEVAKVGSDCGDPALQAMGLKLWADLLRSTGRRARALEVAREALEYVRAAGLRIEAIDLHQSVAHLSVELGDLDDARSHLDAIGPELSTCEASLRIEVACTRALLHHRSGEADAARRALEHAEALAPSATLDSDQAALDLLLSTRAELG